ncbi:hypothetical protein [Rhodococcus sp. IEGM 1318]|uniref:hypothetical protein n=1 Tax=Rhodococcus sp. IEGM 1318 TaxID=3082226 RepID=UPI002952F70E|nr:hypothetical protein [Rhodococcus sp. IEGM 1318]MDV8009037.1 hypothetical protein [Rhodococcus sp. IEGM 1318]
MPRHGKWARTILKPSSTDELKRYGRLRPTLSDNSLDPRVLARDIVIYNFGDARVLLSNTDPVTGTDFGLRRESILKDFATQTLKVS